MSFYRQCSRTACSKEAVATLTYVYSDSTAVLGPLAVSAEPHSYDLCQSHASRLTAPRGWEVVRVSVPGQATQAEPDSQPVSSQSNADTAHPMTRKELAKNQNMPPVIEETPDLDEFEQRKIEISKPLTQPDDDWSAIADVVRVEEAAHTAAAAVPEGFIPPENLVRPRHAATPEPIQQGEVARRGHLRMLRDDS